jgi:hypothetical protein
MSSSKPLYNLDIDKDGEEAETRSQPPPHSPIVHPIVNYAQAQQTAASLPNTLHGAGLSYTSNKQKVAFLGPPSSYTHQVRGFSWGKFCDLDAESKQVALELYDNEKYELMAVSSIAGKSLSRSK